MNAENRCVHCGEDTSFGSGRFVNRIPADSVWEALNKDGKIIFKEGEYRDGYACAECMAMECDRCSEMIPLDEDIRVQNLRVCENCLTKAEKARYDEVYAEDEEEE